MSTLRFKTMKNSLFLAAFTLLSFSAQAQISLKHKSGKFFESAAGKVYAYKDFFVYDEGAGVVNVFDYDSIASIQSPLVPLLSIIDSTKSLVFIDGQPVILYKVDSNFRSAFSSPIIKQSFNEIDFRFRYTQKKLKAAGGWGIASGVFMLGGTITSLIGALKGNQPATITGAALSGAGLVLLIPTFATLKSSGKTVVFKYW